MTFPIPIRRNNVYDVVDRSINLPPNDAKRAEHPTRKFLVMSKDDLNTDESWLTVTGFPLSHNDAYTTQFDVEVPAGEANLRKRSWVQVDMLQPRTSRFRGDRERHAPHVGPPRRLLRLLRRQTHGSPLGSCRSPRGRGHTFCRQPRARM